MSNNENTTSFRPPIGPNQERGIPPTLTPSEQMRVDEYRSGLQTLQERGWDQASVLRFLPWHLTLDGPVHKERRIPGVPTDEQAWKEAIPRVTLNSGLSIPYTHHVVATPEVCVL